MTLKLLLIVGIVSCCSIIIQASEITKFGLCPDQSTITVDTSFTIDRFNGFFPVVAYYQANKQPANTCYRMRFSQDSDDETNVETRWRDPGIYIPGVPYSLDYYIRSTNNPGIFEMYGKVLNEFLGTMYVLSYTENDLFVVYYCRSGLGLYSYDVMVLNPRFVYGQYEVERVTDLLRTNNLEISYLQRVNQNHYFCPKVMDP